MFSNNKGIEKEEISRLLMNLAVFPNLLSNVEIRRIIELVDSERAQILVKSPRTPAEDTAVVSFEEFEEILKKVADKAFPDFDPLQQMSMLIRHVKVQAKIVYGVHLNLGTARLSIFRVQNFQARDGRDQGNLPIAG